MEDIERSLQNMAKMKDGMEVMQKELASYVEAYNEDGLHVEIQGDQIIKNLKFNKTTSPSTVEKEINDANANIKKENAVIWRR